MLDMTVKVTFTITAYTDGLIRARAGSRNGTYVSGTGTYTQYIIPGGTNQYAGVDADYDFVGSVDNISFEIMSDPSKELLNIDPRSGVISDIYDNTVTNTAVTLKQDTSKVMEYDGSTSVLNIDSVLSDLSSTTKGTFLAWVKTEPNIGTKGIVAFGDTNAEEYLELTNTNYYALAHIRKAGTIQWEMNTDDTVLTPGKWNHVVLVHDGTEPAIYINGKEADITFSTSTDKTAWFSDCTGIDNGRIGCTNNENHGDDYFFDGRIGYVKITSQALSANDIAKDYNSSKNSFN